MLNSNFFWDRMEDRKTETINALKQGYNPKIVRFSVHITNNCNLNCSFCNDNRGGSIMPRKLFMRICNRAGKNGVVHITGGEPMTVSWLEDELTKNKGVTRFALNTNMVILPKLETLQSIFRLKMSLDNYESSNRKEHYSKKIISNIKIAIKHVKYSSICYTATHENVSRLDNFISFCKSEFPELFSLSVSFYKGENNNLALTKSDIEKLFITSEKLDPISKQIFLQTHRPTGNFFPDNIKIPCYLSLTERLYDEKGQEYFCSHLYRDHVIPPGNPGKDPHCITGCNARFYQYNKEINEELAKC